MEGLGGRVQLGTVCVTVEDARAPHCEERDHDSAATWWTK